MAHELTFGKGKLVLQVKGEDRIREGTLQISSSGVTWFPRNKKKGYSLTWNKMNELAETGPRKRRRTR